METSRGLEILVASITAGEHKRVFLLLCKVHLHSLGLGNKKQKNCRNNDGFHGANLQVENGVAACVLSHVGKGNKKITLSPAIYRTIYQTVGRREAAEPAPDGLYSVGS